MLTVMYACNDAYVRQTLVSMASVAEHHTQAVFYLIHEGISVENQQFIAQFMNNYGQTLYFIEIERVLPELDLNDQDRHPRTIYAKLFMDSVIQEDRVLYLDSDIVVEDSLEPLFERDMAGELVAGVLMPYSSKVKERIGVLQGQPYICDGVVLFNLELWRRENKSKECREYILAHEGAPPMLSEGVLNYVCSKRIGVLDPKYNLMPSMLMYNLQQIRQLFRADCYYQEEVMIHEACQKPAVHFMNELFNSPWLEPCDHPYKDLYRRTEKRAFGENKISQEPLKINTRRTVFLKKYLPFPIFSILYQIKNRN